MTISICIFGEVLFDYFPDGEQVLGGAPFNVAWHLQAFGQNPSFISRVGDDAEGEQIRQAMRSFSMRIDGLQTDLHLATGGVEVSLSEGEPSYKILHPRAWDAIAVDTLPQERINCLYHGTLALRAMPSAAALAHLREQVNLVFLDVNLRPPWWSPEHTVRLMEQSDWLKLNQAEFNLLLPSKDSHNQRMHDTIKRFGLQGLLITRGAAGALAQTASGEAASITPDPNNAPTVIDTVGAGDAFASVFLLGILKGWPLKLTLERAQQFASAIVSRRGAIVTERSFYTPFMQDWF